MGRNGSQQDTEMAVFESDIPTLSDKEQSTKISVLLLRNELKWKLMQASQAKNKTRLDEIKTELNYYRDKLAKTQDLAARLRERYVKVVNSAKTSETHFKRAELQFQNQERYVADEKMELTKIAMECMSIGRSLYGDKYELPANRSNNRVKGSTSETVTNLERLRPIEDINPQPGGSNQGSRHEILDKLSPFLRQARQHAEAKQQTSTLPVTSTSTAIVNTVPNIQKNLSVKRKQGKSDHNKDLRVAITKKKKTSQGRLSRLYNLDDSILRNITTYRLTSKLVNNDNQRKLLTDLTLSHNNTPHEFVCFHDLINKCTDKDCKYKHKTNYMISDTAKLGEILKIRPLATFNFLLSLQMDHKRPLPVSLDILTAQLPPIDSIVDQCTPSSSSICESNLQQLSQWQQQQQQQRDVSVKMEASDDPMID